MHVSRELATSVSVRGEGCTTPLSQVAGEQSFRQMPCDKYIKATNQYALKCLLLLLDMGGNSIY